jgi:hypothetical protein
VPLSWSRVDSRRRTLCLSSSHRFCGRYRYRLHGIHSEKLKKKINPRSWPPVDLWSPSPLSLHNCTKLGRREEREGNPRLRGTTSTPDLPRPPPLLQHHREHNNTCYQADIGYGCPVATIFTRNCDRSLSNFTEKSLSHMLTTKNPASGNSCAGLHWT